MRIEKFLDTSPLFSLYLAHDEILGAIQARLAKEELHFLQALILTGLFFEERPVRPRELSQALQCSKSNLSHSLRGLEKKGWIERKSAAQDARAYFFTLTREGRRRSARLIKILDSTQSQIEAAPGAHKLNPALHLFRRIYSQIEIPEG